MASILFPSELRKDFDELINYIPELNYNDVFEIKLRNEIITIPYRIYNDFELFRSFRVNKLQKVMLNCILTRHHDGFVRQKKLLELFNVDELNYWEIPFILVM